MDELVSDKEKSNFCDSFKVKSNLAGHSVAVDKSASAKKAFDSLFG